MGKPIGLTALESAIARDFATLNLPAKDWVPERADGHGHRLLDVLIVGGGMCGVTAAFHLRRLGIHNIRVIDQADAGSEGPWLTFARMETLRSPKHLTGPASGHPNLTFRAWYEAQFGADGWHTLSYIPRATWAAYMAWLTRVTGAAVENGVRLTDLERQGDHWRAVLVHRTGAIETAAARVVVLATGREGLAAPRIPEPFMAFYRDGIVHTGDAPARADMSGRDVIVIGLGASAFDYAAEALEARARSVRILGRSGRLARVNKAKQIVYAGFVHGYPLLADTEKLAILEHIFENGIAPPKGTVERVMRHANVELALAASVTEVARRRERLELTTPKGVYSADLVILGTGYRIDLAAAPYLARLIPAIRIWRHSVRAARDSEFLDFPYLGQAFEFLARDGADGADVNDLYCFNHAAMLSLGNLANDIPAVSEGADRLARAIAVRLFLADKAHHIGALHAYQEAELVGDEIPSFGDWWPPVG